MTLWLPGDEPELENQTPATAPKKRLVADDYAEDWSSVPLSVPKPLAGASLFSVNTKNGAWYYLNHANEWHGMPSPIDECDPIRSRSRWLDLRMAADKLAERFWRIHPKEITDILPPITRQEFYAREIKALIDKAFMD